MLYKSTNLEPASALVDLVYCRLSLSTAMPFELCRSRVEVDRVIKFGHHRRFTSRETAQL